MKIKKKIYVFGLTLCLLFVSIFAFSFRVGASSSFIFEGYDVYDDLEMIEGYSRYKYVTYSEIYKNVVLEEKGIDYYKNYNFSFLSFEYNQDASDLLVHLIDSSPLELLSFTGGLSFEFVPQLIDNSDIFGLFLLDGDSFNFQNVLKLELPNNFLVFKGEDLGFLKNVSDLQLASKYVGVHDLETIDIRFYYLDLDYGITETLFSSVSKVVSELSNSLVNGAIEVFAPGGQLSALSIIILSFVGISIAFALVGLVLYLVKLKR